MSQSSLHDFIFSELENLLKKEWQLPRRLEMSLRLLAKYRSTLLHHAMIRNYGSKVLGGPFAGMELPSDNEEGCLMPKLLGCYEAELHPCWERAKNAGYNIIIDIGCGDGYYAIGLSRLLPGIEICAYDTDKHVLQICERMAKVNEVSPRLFNSAFSGADFQQFADRKILVICDIEGGETELLNPVLYPALAGMDIIVELHQTRQGHTVDVVPGRFEKTHQIEIIYPHGRNVELPAMFRQLNNMDQLLAVWEWRSTPTPWAVMYSNEGK